MSNIHVILTNTTCSGQDFRMFLMGGLYSHFKAVKYPMMTYPVLKNCEQCMVRSFIARETTIYGSRVQFYCAAENDCYLQVPPLSPCVDKDHIRLAVTIIQNNVISLVDTYNTLDRIIPCTCDGDTRTQQIDESIIRLVHVPQMAKNTPFFDVDCCKKLPIVIFANLNFLLPENMCICPDENNFEISAEPADGSYRVMACSVPEIIVKAVDLVKGVGTCNSLTKFYSRAEEQPSALTRYHCINSYY